MKVKLEVEVQVNHDENGAPHSCPELVQKHVKQILDKGFLPRFFSPMQYMFATKVKAIEASDFDPEVAKKSGWISKFFGTEK